MSPWSTPLLEIVVYIGIAAMPKFLVNFTDDQLKGLRELSQQTGIPVASYVRQGTDLILQRSPVRCDIVVSGVLVSGVAFLIRG